jgi:hypothetical protein
VDLIKPLLSHGAAYAAELPKCMAAGVLVSGAVLVVLILVHLRVLLRAFIGQLMWALMLATPVPQMSPASRLR